MKLLLDQGLPRSSAAILREAGFDAVHTGEISLQRVGFDDQIINASRYTTELIASIIRRDGLGDLCSGLILQAYDDVLKGPRVRSINNALDVVTGLR
ncbi:hypothetical protein BH20ACI3_BH20ACI3_27630 [soil metagenome]